jgi:type I restriction enzyme S subunit
MKAWPKVALAELLRPADEPVAVRQDQAYPNFGIYSFGRGLFAKPPIDGMQTSAGTLYRVRAGNFIYSRLFAFEGSYGLVDEAFDGHFTSNEYPSFELDRTRLVPGFLKAFFQFPRVWQDIAMGSKGVGSRRNRVQPDKVLAHAIALPSLDEQEAIVARLDLLNEKTRQLEAHLDAVERDAEHLLALRFRDAIAHAPLRPMAEVAPLVRRDVAIEPNRKYTELGVRSFYKGVFHRRTVPGSDFSWQDIYRVRSGDLIFSNIMAWEKAIAIATQGDDGCIGNHRMLTCEANAESAVAVFLWFYFTTDEGFAKVYAASPGTAARNRTMTAPALMAIDVPIPPLATQRTFSRLHTEVMSLKAKHSAIRQANAALLPATLERVFAEPAAVAN